MERESKDGETDGVESPTEETLSPPEQLTSSEVMVPQTLEVDPFLAAIVASSADAIIGMTLSGEIVAWNAAAERLYGYSAAEMVGRDIATLFPRDRAEELPQILHRIRHGETVQELLTERVKKDGTLIAVSVTVSPVLALDGSVVGAATSARDMTAHFEAVKELEQAHRATAEALSMLETLQDTAPVGFGFIDPELRIVRLNEMLAAVNGSSVHDQVGLKVAEVIPQIWPQLEPVCRRVLEAGESVVNIEISGEIRAEPGKVHHWLTSCYPVVTDGQMIGIGVVVFDITERKRADAELRAFESRLRQSERLESLGQLAGGVAHDFNNLLTIILNYAAFVAEEVNDRPAVLTDVQHIQRAAERAVELTRQLLIFGRGDITEPEVLDLNAVVADVYNLLARSIGEHIELRVVTGSNVRNIRADRGQIEQVLLNLALNARDAMSDGGTLTIETGLIELDEIYSQLHPELTPGHYVELAVSDVGTGMSPEIASHIFEPFFTTKPQGEGTGLGLATVYGIVSDAGGTVNVYSEEGIGTTFRLYFPPTDLDTTTRPTGLDSIATGLGETILIVEDEPSVLEVASRILRQNGYLTLEAANCDDALSLAASNDFQLLLTDSVMPNMSGPTLAQHIEELRPGRPVLYMSGYSGGVLSPQRVLDEGLAFLQKPFNRHRLLEKVRATLSGPPAGSPKGQ
jgi:PAS domain S-box-containing protein